MGCGDSTQMNQSAKITMSFYLVVVLLLNLVLMVVLLIRRDYFRIKERSPYTLCLGIVANMLFSALFPLFALVSTVPGYAHLDPNLDISIPSNMTTAILYWRTIYYQSLNVFYFCLCIRTIRIAVAILSTSQNRILIALMNNEKLLIFMAIVLPFFYLPFSQLNKCMHIPFFDYVDYSKCDCHGFYCNTTREGMMLLMALYNFIFPLQVYLLRQVPYYLSFSGEMFWLSLINYLVYFIFELSFPLNDHCIGYMPIIQIIYDFRNALFLLLAAAVPLGRASLKALLMPQANMLEQDDNYFLEEQYLFRNLNRFMQYHVKLLNQPIQDGSFFRLDRYSHQNVYFSFYSQITMLKYNQGCDNEEELEQKRQRMTQIIEEQVMNNLSAFPDFVESLQQTQTNIRSDSGSMVLSTRSIIHPEHQQDISSEQVYHLIDYAQRQLFLYVHDYRRTKSYQALKRELKDNDLKNSRLYLFRMVSTNC